MKVLFINHKDIVGGAAIAAYRLAMGLEKYHGTETYFIVAEKSSGNDRVFSLFKSRSETRKKTYQYIVYLFDRIMNKLGLQYQCFPFTSRFILRKVRQIKPDVISLHNTHGGYFKTALIRKLSKVAPVVWTLHDMWSFTANAAHTFGDESWKQMKSGEGEKKIYPHIGINTGNWLLRQKRKIYKNSDLHPVIPSLWLYNQASQSPVFAGKKISQIYHGLDLETFSPMDKKLSREVLGMDPDLPVIMFSCSEDLNINPWKGGRLLSGVLDMINTDAPRTIKVIVLGQGQLDFRSTMDRIQIEYMGYVQNEKFIRLLLNAADLFIYPTKADSLGLVLLESIACGTPCVSFDIGGCGEIVREGVSGFLIEPFNVKKFADVTLKLLNNQEQLEKLSRSCRKFAEEKFSIEEMSDRYHKYFKSVGRSQSSE